MYTIITQNSKSLGYVCPMNNLRKIRLYSQQSLTQGEVLELSADHSHYLINVMRVCEGEAVRLFNETDGEYVAHITRAHKKKTSVVLGQQLHSPRLSKTCHLYLTPLKKQALSYAIEKATECGVTHIHFIQTEYTDHNKVNLDRLRATAIEASEQCRRFDIPQIFDVQPLVKTLKNWPQDKVLFLAAEDGRGKLVKEIDHQKSDIPALMIGPEGGFSAEEFELLSQHPDVKFLSLGNNILRAETAIVVGLSQVLLT